MARLTKLEIEMLLAAAGNVDPSMFYDTGNDKDGDRDRAAWESGQEKLREMLRRRSTRPALTRPECGGK
jgi:hypothetical protein